MANFIVNQTTDDGTGLTAGTLSYAILQANQLAGDDTITINNDVRVTGVVKTLVNSNITIVGNNHSISGDVNNNGINDDGDVRPLFILSGTVGISDLTITNGRAKGGDSFNGGGGAGLGGGLFIYDGNVSLTNVGFTNNAAQGGSSGVGGLGRGGGGMFGNGGGGGGGGLFAGSINSYTGYGGYGGNGNYGGGVGAFGGGGTFYGTGASGGVGGGGGGGGFGGGSGGFGGGGGYGSSGDGGYGGYGGGGGGGGYGGGRGGVGGVGGGRGGDSGFDGYGYSVGGVGGGGAGLGGGIFVRSGSLTLNNTSFTNNTATGGTGANSGQGLGGAIFIMQSTNNTNGNNQGIPTVLPTVTSSGNPSFSGNSAADDAGTATNNDDVYGTINGLSITALTPIANEGGSNGVFRLTRVNTNGDLTVNLSIDGSSTASTADYTLSGGSVSVSGNTLTVTIADGQSFVDLNLAAIDDIQAEAAETLQLNLDTGTGYTVDSTNNTATVTIAANDTVVTNTNDSGEGSLRQAILNANAFAGADTITFAGSVFTDATPDTITLTFQPLYITDSLTINGLGASNLSISGNNSFFVNRSNNNGNQFNVAINDLAFTGASNGGQRIFNQGNLTINNVTISGNSGLFYGGIANFGTATINNSTISGNSGAISGGISNYGTLSLTNSTISGNSGSISGGIANYVTLNLTNSTISGNSAIDYGGGIFNESGTINLISSTITNNTADSGNYGYGDGGGIYNKSGTVTAQNTIIAGNFDSGNEAPDISGTVTGDANNLIGSQDGTSGTIGTGSDITFASAGITNINQVLAALANNGGVTQTHALVAGSAAINAGNNALVPGGVTTDQRGTGFNRINGGTVDIGAYENNAAAIAGTATAAVTEDTNVVNGNLTATGSLTVSDVDNGENIFNTNVTSGNGNLGSLSITQAGAYTYTVANSAVQYLGAGVTKTDTFTVSSIDGTASQNIVITINGVNDVAAIAGTATAAVTEDTNVVNGNLTATGSLTVSDVDNGENIFNTNVTSGNGNLGSLSITQAGAYTYTVANSAVQYLGAGVTKTDTFTVSSIDGTASQDIIITINGVNDAPVGSPTATLSNTPEDTAITITAANLLTGFSDVDAGDTLSVNNLTATNGALVNNNNGTYTFTPNANFNGTVNLTYNVTDGVATLSGQTRSFSVTPVNDAPVAVDDSVSTFFGTTVNIPVSTLLANDSDVDSTSLSITGVSGATHGTAVLNNNGTANNTADDFVSFTPSLLFVGNASFNYTLSDGSLTDTGTVTVAVGGNIFGTNFADYLTGTSGNDIINGGNGNDTIYGGAGNDSLDGGNGNDILYGDGLMDGGAGNDTLSGGNGDDTLYGGGGSDYLSGGNGNDLLYGGASSDILTGNNGNDIFAFAAGEGTDTITDFSKGNDLIGLYGGLSFGQLSFSGNNIKVTSTNEILATLTGINTTTLTAANFVTL